MKRHLLILLCAAVPLIAHAADNPDKSFYKDAAEAGMAEVNDGMLASDKATDPKLKEFAAMMIKDHGEANEKLSQLAGTKDIKLPKSASVKQMAEHEKLKLESGETFDKAYIKDQLSDHRSTLRLLHKEINTGKDPDAQAFAKEILPTIQKHMRAIDKIAKEEGVTS
ncbi:MAG TPA: DUF4142 domain-containing protein [Steroidobacteraceae bacterium]|nr:DUF4142 domain-containing protein [Steroidobacteraceae bacterium]